MYGQAKKYVCLLFTENVHAGSVGRTPGEGGGYSHIRTVRVCAARKPTSATPKDSTFSTWAASKDPLFKSIQFFVPLFRPGQIEKTLA